MSTQNRMPKSFNAVPKPFNFQSTQQSPSFIKAVKPPSANPSGIFASLGMDHVIREPNLTL